MEAVRVLSGKRIVLGVTGGIAAYKVAWLASRLTQAGAEVDVVVTEAGQRFVAPITFHSLTGRPVYTDMWAAPGDGLSTHIAHVGLAHAADLMVIAPATANTLAKLAAGLADNLLTTLALAARCPILVAPAMDVGMWSNRATQANATALQERGVHFAGPARGRMASGLEGEGRLVEPDELLGHVRWVMGRSGTLSGTRVVVTAGPTREAIDAVRFLSNPSSGRQGFALAQAALDRGADVTLVTGPTNLDAPVGARRLDVVTADNMLAAVLSETDEATVLLMSAAVSDYRPAEPARHKIKKTGAGLTLNLVPTCDILSAVADRRLRTGYPRTIVGFAAESENVVQNARAKLAAKGLDLIVANDITAADSGFEVETNRVALVHRDNTVEKLPLMSKAAVAEAVLDRVVEMLSDRT
jgi:phosphopantothenoylcysteine decarboxylase/phosphopantothenate--cysteine ligase